MDCVKILGTRILVRGLKTCLFFLISVCFLLLLCFSSKAQIASRVITNPSFELPAKNCSPANWSLIPQSEMSGWKTTDTGTTRIECGTTVSGAISNPIEIWSNGFGGVTAYSGTQLAEINANANGFLYQEVCLLANEVVSYSIWHHRRGTSGKDIFRARLADSAGTLIAETSDLSSANNSWNNFTGTLTNNAVSGLRQYGFRAISTGSGSVSSGNLIDEIIIALRPLVDINSFSNTTIAEAGGTSNFEIRVNGTLRSSAVIVFTKTGTATVTTDYTIGTPSRGTVSVAANGNITLTLAAGDYDPNLSTGSTAGLISIPITAVNDAVLDDNETLTYTIGTITGGGGGTASLDLIHQINGQSTACSTVNGTAGLTIKETRADLSITKSQRPGTINAFQTTNLSVTQNQIVQYRLLVTNNGPSTVSNAVITDNVPSNLSGLSVVSAASANGATACSANFSGNTLTGNFSSPNSGTCTIIIQGTAATAGNITNTATITAPGIIVDPTSSNNSSAVNTNILTPPNISLVKSCPIPANCTSTPQMPGTDVSYQIVFTNTGGQAAANMAIVDRIPDNTDYKIGSAAANAGTTGLTFTIEYSNDYDPLNPTLASWIYTPISGGGGAIADYDRLVKAVRWRVTAGTLSNTVPNNIGDVSFVTKIR